jgi:hypothetical protein
MKEKHTIKETFLGLSVFAVIFGALYLYALITGEEPLPKTQESNTSQIKEDSNLTKKPIKKRTPKEEKEEWKNSTDELHVEIVSYFMQGIAPFVKLESRYGKKALKPHVYSIVDCVDKAVSMKKYEKVGIDLMVSSCIVLELAKIKKNQ